MDYIKLNEAISFEISKIKKEDIFINYLKCKSIIDTKYKKELDLYLKCKKDYEKALEFGEYYPDYKKIKANYLESKSNLFSFEEVKLYFNYLHLIEDKYNLILDEVKNEILK